MQWEKQQSSLHENIMYSLDLKVTFIKVSTCDPKFQNMQNKHICKFSFSNTKLCTYIMILNIFMQKN
jgi:hypothetical protein